MQLSQTEQANPLTPETPDGRLFERNRLIEDAMGLVHATAAQLLRVHHLPMLREDLVSCGMSGLVRAADGFDPTRGTLFKTYAYTFIRGAMLDGLRCGAGLNTRAELRRMKTIAAETGDSDGHGGRTLAPLRCLTALVADVASALLAHKCSEDDAANPEAAVERSIVSQRVRRAIAALPARERQVVELLYYRCDNSFKDVAEVLGVTRPHIFRIHARAVARLKEPLAELAGE